MFFNIIYAELQSLVCRRLCILPANRWTQGGHRVAGFPNGKKNESSQWDFMLIYNYNHLYFLTVILRSLMVETYASHDGSTGSNPVEGARPDHPVL